MKEEEEANADSTVETKVPSLQRSMDAEAPGHQKVQPGAVEEQFEKKLEQLEDQLEEHAQDAAAHGEVEKVRRLAVVARLLLVFIHRFVVKAIAVMWKMEDM